jgi:hypothetical protein
MLWSGVLVFSLKDWQFSFGDQRPSPTSKNDYRLVVECANLNLQCFSLTCAGSRAVPKAVSPNCGLTILLTPGVNVSSALRSSCRESACRQVFL